LNALFNGSLVISSLVLAGAEYQRIPMCAGSSYSDGFQTHRYEEAALAIVADTGPSMGSGQAVANACAV